MENSPLLRLERHLSALEHVDPASVPAILGRHAFWEDGAVDDEIRSLLAKEESYLSRNEKISLSPIGPTYSKNPQRISEIREAGKYLTELLEILREASVEGAAYLELDLLARAYAHKYRLSLPIVWYGGFPNSLTVGVNDRVVHGFADETTFRRGDLVTLDTVVGYRGGIADAAVAFVVGGESANPLAAKLTSTLKSVLDANLSRLRSGVSVSEFAFSLYDGYVSAGYRVIKNCNGHSVGVEMHESPWIHHWPNSETDRTVLRAGDVVTVEPIVTHRTNLVEYPDSLPVWILSAGDIGAYWEYTLLITDGEPEILAGIR